MSNPAHEGIRTGKLLAWDEVDKTGVQYMCVRLNVYNDLIMEFNQAQAEITKLREALEEIYTATKHAVDHPGMSCIAYMAKTSLDNQLGDSHEE